MPRTLPPTLDHARLRDPLPIEELVSTRAEYEMTINIATRALRPPVPMDGGNHKGVKEIHIRATATGFEPANPSIPAGKKVILIVDVRQAPACAKTMQVDPLNVSAKADHHDRIELAIPPQDKDAKLVLRCSMGMLKTKVRVNP